MKLALIALRNLGRNRRRTVLSLLVVACGAAALILTAGFVRFSFEGLAEAIIHGGLGHLEVAQAGDTEGAATSLERSARPPGWAQWEGVRTAIEGRPHVRAAGAVIQFAGVAHHDLGSTAFFGVAVEPDRERRMGMEVKLRGGQDLAPAAPPEGSDQVLLGVGLARALGVRPGDTIALVAPTASGSLDAMDVTVRGLVTTGLQELDGRVLKTHVVTAQRLLGTANVTALVVGLDDAAHTETARADLLSLRALSGGGFTVQDWQTRAPFYRQVRALYSGIFVFLGALVFALVILSTSNTLLMSVLERVREFGTLRAIGTSRGQVAALVVFEALWLGLLGGLIGGGLGLGLSLLINALRIRMPPPPGAADPLDLALQTAPSDVILALAFMVLVLGTASLVPAVRVVRLRIVEALGHD